MLSGRWQNRTILVATGGGTKVYSDTDEMPAPLRTSLDRALHGEISATILIADSRGKQEIGKLLQELKDAAARHERASESMRRFAWQCGILGALALLSWAALTLR